MNPALRVVIVDDAVLLREGVRQLLVTGGCDVVAVAADIEELFEALAAVAPVDALVIDIRMPPTHTDEGVRALERLRAEGSRVGVLVLSMYSSPALAHRVMRAGAGTGYLIKDRVTDSRTLVEAVRTVAGGGTVVDPDVIAQLVAQPRPVTETLTSREQEVLVLMAQGKSNLGIADALVLSPKTIESHVAAILMKLGIEGARDEHRRVLAVLTALRAAREG